jgi:valyl-tRNA synthetase
LDLLRGQCKTIGALANLDIEHSRLSRMVKEDTSALFSLVVSGVEVFLDLANPESEQLDADRMKKELEQVNAQIERLEKLLGSDFGSKAPPAVVEKERARLTEFIETRDKLIDQLG